MLFFLGFIGEIPKWTELKGTVGFFNLFISKNTARLFFPKDASRQHSHQHHMELPRVPAAMPTLGIITLRA